MLLILLGHRMLTEGLDVSIFVGCHVVECVAERASVTALLINNLKDYKRHSDSVTKIGSESNLVNALPWPRPQ